MDRASVLEKSDHFRVYVKSRNLKQNINTKFYPATSLDYAIESIAYAVRLANQSKNFSILQDEVTHHCGKLPIWYRKAFEAAP